jgi:hypothetical protein
MKDRRLNKPIKLPPLGELDMRRSNETNRVEMSVQSSQFHYCGYGTKEVRLYGINRCPYGWKQYMEQWSKGECYDYVTNQVFGHVPDEIILKYAVSKNIDAENLEKLKKIFRKSKVGYTKRIEKLTGLDKLDELYKV